MNQEEFKTAFQELTGNPPFPWQQALWEQFVSDRPDHIPKSCNLPTGLGKTSVIAIWLLALIHDQTKMPRRLVYVVNRRTVVDQTTIEVEKLRENLPKLKLPIKNLINDLAISTLRGQFADNREWSADPSLPAVICGTVDMIGSRLLFSGYGIGFKTRPLHAGFLGQDVLLVHDEAHLEPAFQKLLIAIEKEQREGRFPDRHPLRVMELSATSRGQGKVFGLTPGDHTDDVVKQRIHAKKTLVFHPINDEKKELADKLVELALVHKDSQQAILIFVRTVDDLGKIVVGLQKEKQNVQQLTGTMRGLERDRMADPRNKDASTIFARFLKPPKADASESERWNIEPMPGTVYLVCTSAGEVGVNISGDDLVCDLSTFESMAQRLGRVNRFGLRDDTRIDIVYPATFKKDDKIDPSRERTLALLKKLDGNGSPAALSSFDLEERVAAFSPQPAILPTSDILFDAWSLTTIKDKLPGRPPVAEYLHGVSDWEPPQTKVGWRSEVWELRRSFNDDRERREFERYAAELLDDYPLKTHELLTDRSDRIFKTLGQLKLSAGSETPAWMIDEDSKITLTTLGAVIARDSKFIASTTLLLPPQAGGLDNGFLTAAAKYDSNREDYDVADEWRDEKNNHRRIRVWDDEPVPIGMRLIRRPIDTRPELDDEDTQLDSDQPMQHRFWRWFELPAGADTDGSRFASKAVRWQVHTDDVTNGVKEIIMNLSLPADLKNALIVSATFHDLGKLRDLFQRMLGNSNFDDPLAKSGARSKRLRLPEKYRHEFGSLMDVDAKSEFQSLCDDMKDLMVHLIAAHHGYARPHFPPDQAFDPQPKSLQRMRDLSIETPQRFARLQRTYGRWGLAYIESLLRAADYAASAKPSETVEDDR